MEFIYIHNMYPKLIVYKTKFGHSKFQVTPTSFVDVYKPALG